MKLVCSELVVVVCSAGSSQTSELNFSLSTYFIRLVDLKILQRSPELETSPDLSESFELNLKQLKAKAEAEKMKRAKDHSEAPRTSRDDPVRQSPLSNETNYGADNTMMRCSDDSFLEMEKLCERTLHLNNVSENLIDLTAFEMSLAGQRKSPKTNSMYGDETRLNDVEAPSFLLNNSSMMSPNKNSPVIPVHANRPSTILEVSEISLSNKTCMSSYRTALTGRSETASSEDYRTANEDTFGRSGCIEEEMLIKMPKIRSFYEVDLTKDSLDSSGKIQHSIDLTKDSLNADSYVDESSSGVDSTFDQRDDSANGGEQLNDTLERIEYMLAQHQKMLEQKTQEPKTPRCVPPSPVSSQPGSSSAKPKVFSKVAPMSTRNSPLIKFSPAVNKNSPSNDIAFKRPCIQSNTKIPQPFLSSKKFQHVASPIARYINDTPGYPLASTVRVHPGIGKSPKLFNFRDSEAFANENESMNAGYTGSSLPAVAKTKSSATSHVRISHCLHFNDQINFKLSLL